MSDSFLSTAGFLFFAVWGLIVGLLSATVFGRDLLPAKTEKEADPLPQTRPINLPPAGTHLTLRSK